MRLSTLVIAVLIVTFGPASVTPIDFVHPSDVVKRMKKRFKEMESYKANFSIQINDAKKRKLASGIAYFKKGGRLNFTFKKPYGDKIISDGRRLWVYIASLRAVGIQDMKSAKGIYSSTNYEGLVSLFRRYHYRFNKANQPETHGGAPYYVLNLKEKTVSGGFTRMLIYVDTQQYLIRQIDAFSDSGRKVTLKFSNIALNKDLPNKLFTYRIEGSTRVIENPLTTE